MPSSDTRKSRLPVVLRRSLIEGQIWKSNPAPHKRKCTIQGNFSREKTSKGLPLSIKYYSIEESYLVQLVSSAVQRVRNHHQTASVDVWERRTQFATKSGGHRVKPGSPVGARGAQEQGKLILASLRKELEEITWQIASRSRRALAASLKVTGTTDRRTRTTIFKLLNDRSLAGRGSDRVGRCQSLSLEMSCISHDILDTSEFPSWNKRTLTPCQKQNCLLAEDGLLISAVIRRQTTCGAMRRGSGMDSRLSARHLSNAP
ncbi:hypothetical protein Naga_100007g85 [Nannochloropsis gaditana]|uniref:Uncharacterized protein n=1 Tax=Nannochloropsis gaditana TaxID=72520 RepID=W7U046_9STRA|nr:hypothetical protein Naga_100007g85 [Nannochloropsis gaditana]